MGLRKLNESPRYSLTIPSTGQKVNFRPYLVKEEKIMMMAFESGDMKQSLTAIVDTIDACLIDKVNVSKLTTFDVEYMFTKMRAKSVGETARVIIRCKDEECGHGTEVEVDLDSIEINVPKSAHRIAITDTVELEMVYPSYLSIVEGNLENLETDVTAGFDLIAQCINAVQYQDERVVISDQPESDVKDFVESLTSGQFMKIMEFVNQMPSMKKDVKFECGKCNKVNEVRLEGMSDFF